MTAISISAAPCNACPWLIANQGKRTPDGCYTKANRTRLWSKMRRGEHMSCHPTDHRNPVSEAQQAAGYRAAPEHSETKQCVGAVILQQREVMVLQEIYGSDPREYAKHRQGHRLTRDGLIRVVQDYLFGGTFFGGGGASARPNLHTPVKAPGLDWPLADREDAYR